MKLAAIYNVWSDSIELLQHSIKSIINHVDIVIIIYQNESNFGEESNVDFVKFEHDNIIFKQYKPGIELGGNINETNKRNEGLNLARKYNCTHFLFMDCDELWSDFDSAKSQYIASGAEGSVAQMYTYFKKPTLRLKDVDNYYVPFIHKLRKDTVAGSRNYSFYCDPTRSVNCLDIALITERMHHFSWVRRDIGMKIRNSSARDNIKVSQLPIDYDKDVQSGYYLVDYQQELIEVPNLFNIPYPL